MEHAPCAPNFPDYYHFLNLIILFGPHIWFQAMDALVIFYEDIWPQLLAHILGVDLSLTVTKHL